jgi:hypothetical protein
MLRRLSICLIAALAYAGAALADPPTLSIRQQAPLDTGGVIVYLDVNCGAGSSAALLLVEVRQGTITFHGTMPFTSTGNKQVIAAQVLGAFAPGAAMATAELDCGGMPEGLTLGATINIFAP